MKMFLPKFVSIIAFLAALLVVSSPTTVLAASQTHNASAQGHVGSTTKTSKAALIPFTASGCYHVPNDYDCTGEDPFGPNGPSNPSNPNCVNDSYKVPGGSTQLDTGGGLVFEIDLMYSPACRSNWAQMVWKSGDISNQTNIFAEVYRVAVKNGLGAKEEDGQTINDGIYAYSPMVYAPYNPAYACGYMVGAGSQCGHQE